MRNIDEDPFAGLGAPLVPPGIKELAVNAGRRAMARSPQPDIWYWLWTSRTVRLAWVVGVAVLMASHLVIPVEPVARPEGFAMPILFASADESGELAEIIDLPRITDDLPTFAGPGDQPREETQS